MENTPRTRVAGTRDQHRPCLRTLHLAAPLPAGPTPHCLPTLTRGKRCCVRPGPGSREAGTPSSPPADIAAFSPVVSPANDLRWRRPSGRPGEGLAALLRFATRLLLSRSHPLASCWSAASRPPVPPSTSHPPPPVTQPPSALSFASQAIFKDTNIIKHISEKLGV